MLLDSTFLNDLVREDEAAVAKLDELIAEETPVTISPLTIFEVGVGLRGDAVSFRDRFQRVIDQLDTAPLTRRRAEQALSIQYDLYERGKPIGAVDVLLAGTATTLSDPRVLTRNTDEFKRVETITVESY